MVLSEKRVDYLALDCRPPPALTLTHLTAMHVFSLVSFVYKTVPLIVRELIICIRRGYVLCLDGNGMRRGVLQILSLARRKESS